MNWKLKVWPASTTHANQTDANTRAIYTPASPGGIIGGFEWSRDPSGNCKQLTWSGSPSDRRGNSRLDISSRDIVQLQVDANDDGIYSNEFHGVVTELPNPRDSRVGEYVALGSKALFQSKVMDDSRDINRSDVSLKVNSISPHFPDQVSYSAPANTGYELSELYAPYASIAQVLDALAQTVPGYEWGVNASGEFLFAIPAGSTTIAFTDAVDPWAGLAVHDTITKVWLPVLSEPVGRNFDAYNASGPGGYTESFSGKWEATFTPAAHAYEDSEHATYGAEAARLVHGIYPFAEKAAGSTSGTNITNLANAFDGSNSTYAENTAGGNARVRASYSDRVYGARLRYQLTGGSNAILRIIRYNNLSAAIQVMDVPLASASSAVTVEMLIPDPGDIIFDRDDVVVMVDSLAAAGDLRVYELEPLELDDTLLDRIGANLIRLPAGNPLSLDVAGIVDPVASVTLSGAPGGSVTGDAALWRYSLTPDSGLRTIVESEQPGEGSTARAIRLTAERSTQTSQDSLRVYLGR